MASVPAFCHPALSPSLRTPLSLQPLLSPRLARRRLQTRSGPRASRTPATPYAALLVVDLPSATSGRDSRAVASFSERVKVDRARAPAASYLLYSTEEAYDQAVARIAEHELPEGDAIAAVGGLYQRGYATPDPYWGRRMWKAWDPKPTRWVVDNFFQDLLEERGAEGDSVGDDRERGEEEEFEIVFNMKTGSGPDEIEVKNQVEAKMKEMGVSGSVSVKRGDRGKERAIAVRPAVADVGEVADFCKMMLKLEGSGSVCAFGGRQFVEEFVRNRVDAVGVVGADGEGVGENDERVYYSSKEGVSALLEGVVHHAVF